MNYSIESGFLDDDSLMTILWAEKMLSNFIGSGEWKLGLNKCSNVERKMMKLLCKCFLVEYVDNGVKCYIEKTVDSRCPYLVVKDYLTSHKMNANFTILTNKFHDNTNVFPLEFAGYQSTMASRDEFLKNVPKPTNKEVSMHEMSMRSRASSNSDDSKSLSNMDSQDYSKFNLKINADKMTKNKEPDTQQTQAPEEQLNSKPEEVAVKPEAPKEMEEIVSEQNNEGKTSDVKTTGANEETKGPEAETELKKEEKEETTPSEIVKKKKKEHGIVDRNFEKPKWTKNCVEDKSRLPSVYHILFVVIDRPQEKEFLQIFAKKTDVLVKYVKLLGAFVVCHSEFIAKSYFELLSSDYLVFPFKDVPKEIQNNQLRCEIGFMEGIRPQKTTVVAERFIYKHLGFK
jgi:hypothetical protein